MTSGAISHQATPGRACEAGPARKGQRDGARALLAREGSEGRDHIQANTALVAALIAYADAHPSWSSAMNILKHVDPPQPKFNGMRPEELSDALAHAVECFEVTEADILGRSRQRPIAAARQHVIRRLNGLGYSAGEIGRALNRDHTTVLHAIGKVAA